MSTLGSCITTESDLSWWKSSGKRSLAKGFQVIDMDPSIGIPLLSICAPLASILETCCPNPCPWLGWVEAATQFGGRTVEVVSATNTPSQTAQSDDCPQVRVTIMSPMDCARHLVLCDAESWCSVDFVVDQFSVKNIEPNRLGANRPFAIVRLSL